MSNDFDAAALDDRYHNDESTGNPPELEWEDDVEFYLLAVTWFDQNDIAMHEQQLGLLVDEEEDSMVLSTETGLVDQH